MTGEELKERRDRLGISQRTLAEKLGTTQNTIYRWENELMEIQNAEMLKLALERLEQSKKN